MEVKRIRSIGMILGIAVLICCAGCKGGSFEENSSVLPGASALETSSEAVQSTLLSQPEADNLSQGTASVSSRSTAAISSKGSASVQHQSSSQTTSMQAPTVSSTPPRKTIRITIPEGFTFLQIAKRLEANGVCSAKEFYQTAQSYSPASFTIPANSSCAYKMEGYLYPDTYEFYANDNPQDVLIKMLNNYRAKAGTVTSQQLIVASIVEKESRSSENAALVASVVYNRLSSGMRLEIDSTREYVNQHITGSPLLSDTSKYAAVYNTYKCAALPAGPICNPGNRAIQAAKNPASSEYLFFFYGNDNQNHYSKTYEEHQAAMKQYGVQYGS